MNKYFILLFICSATALYGQNAPSNKKTYDQKIAEANKAYEKLILEEKAVCNLLWRNYAVQHARMLQNGAQSDLIPAEISPEEKLSEIDSNLAIAKSKVTLSEKKSRKIHQIAYYRIAGLYKTKADSLGKECTWIDPDNSEDTAQ